MTTETVKSFVTLTGFGEVELPEQTLADAIAFERHFGVSATAMEAPKMEYVAFLMFRQAGRLKLSGFPTDFDAFIELVEEIRVVEPDGGESDPS